MMEDYQTNLSSKELYDRKRQERLERRQQRKDYSAKKFSGLKVFGLMMFVLLSLVGGFFWFYWQKIQATGNQISDSINIEAYRPGDHVVGSSTAPLIITEYSDFQCPACAVYHEWLGRLITEPELSGQVAWVFRHFPLPGHFASKPAIQAVEAAARQGKFKEYSDLLFARQTAWVSHLTWREIFITYAQELALAVEQFTADYDSASGVAVADQALAEAESLGLSYTPSFFINGQLIENPASYVEFKKLLQSYLSSTSK